MIIPPTKTKIWKTFMNSQVIFYTLGVQLGPWGFVKLTFALSYIVSIGGPSILIICRICFNFHSFNSKRKKSVPILCQKGTLIPSFSIHTWVFLGLDYFYIFAWGSNSHKLVFSFCKYFVKAVLCNLALVCFSFSLKDLFICWNFCLDHQNCTR